MVHVAVSGNTKLPSEHYEDTDRCLCMGITNESTCVSYWSNLTGSKVPQVVSKVLKEKNFYQLSHTPVYADTIIPDDPVSIVTKGAIDTH